MLLQLAANHHQCVRSWCAGLPVIHLVDGRAVAEIGAGRQRQTVEAGPTVVPSTVSLAVDGESGVGDVYPGAGAVVIHAVTPGRKLEVGAVEADLLGCVGIRPV